MINNIILLKSKMFKMLEIPFTQIISQGNNNKMLPRFKTSDNPDI